MTYGEHSDHALPVPSHGCEGKKAQQKTDRAAALTAVIPVLTPERDSEALMDIAPHHADKTSPELGTFRYQESETGCWIWQGYIDPNGYGRIYDRGNRRIEWAHRHSYRIHKGDILPRHEIDHTCETPPCVNPSHLDQVTKSEHARRTWQRLGKDDLHGSAAEMRMAGWTYREIAEALSFSGPASAHEAVASAIRKGLVSAEDVPQPSRLTEAECEDIRRLHRLGIPQTVVARFYGIDSSQVSRICSGKRHAAGAA